MAAVFANRLRRAAKLWYNADMNRRKLKILVNGKVNLSLNILGVQAGKHLLDTVMASVNLTDAVTVCERFDGKSSVQFDAPFAIPADNTVTRTWKILTDRFGALGADIFVEKGLPLAGGLGGSSADCAAVLLAADRLFDLSSRGLDLPSAAFAAGSDVPFQLTGGVARVRGMGEDVTPSTQKQPLHLVLAHAGEGVNTAVCYAHFDKLYPQGRYAPADNDRLLAALRSGEIEGVAEQAHNALMQPAFAVTPSVRRAYDAVRDTACTAALMSGSGCCVAGLYPDADAAAKAQRLLAAAGLWAQCADTTDCGITVL